MAQDYFWTDIDQASQRLTNSVVLYDGQPVFIERVEPHEDGAPRARIYDCINQDAGTSRKKLNSPKFARFRELPNIGWTNIAGRAAAVFVSRQAVTTRTHGLTAANTRIEHVRFEDTGSLAFIAGAFTFPSLVFNKGWVDAHNGIFPSLEAVLQQIQPRSAIAFTRLLAVIRDVDGIRWLYREKQRVGVFTGVDTLNLVSRYAYLREEIMAEPLFTLNTIREF